MAREPIDAYWSRDVTDLCLLFGATRDGLSSAEADSRLRRYGRNELREHRSLSGFRILWNQLRSPLLLLLVFAAGASALTDEWIDASIIFVIVAATVTIGFSR